MGSEARTPMAVVVALAMMAGACSGETAHDQPVPEVSQAVPAADPARTPTPTPPPLEPERPGEHDRDRRPGAGEESGTELALHDRYETVRNGVRLILAFDAEGGAFRGTIENVTAKPIERVRVEIHLSSGREVGPTPPVTLASGESRTVTLPVIRRDFDRWTTHVEAGRREHGR